MRTTPKLSDEVNARGYWEIRWSEQREAGWRSMRLSTKTGDRDLAELVLAKFLADRTKADPTIRHKVSDVIDAYLRHYSLPRGNAQTDGYALRAPRLALGWMDPHALTGDDIDAYTRARQRGEHGPKPVAASTVRRELQALQAALNWGSQKRLMVQGKMVFAFDKPAAAPRRDLWLTEAQEREIMAQLHEASPSVQLFVRMGLLYGVRAGAMMDLRFGPQVSFISEAIDFKVPGRRVTRKRRPVAPMTEDVRRLLQILFQQRGPAGHVLDRSTGADYEAFMERLGYGWVTPHVLKHSAITLMLRGGVRPEDVSAATATDIKTILEVYRHHCMDELRGIVGRRRS